MFGRANIASGRDVKDRAMTNKGPTVRSLEKKLDDLELKIQRQAEQSDQKLNEFHNTLATVNNVQARVQILEKDVPSRIHELKAEIQKESHEFSKALQSEINALKLEIQRQCQDLSQSLQKEINLLELQIPAQAQQSQQMLNDLQNDLAEFKGSVNTSLSFAKWIGGFAAIVIVSLTAFSWQFSGANGQLVQNVKGLGERVEKLEERMKGIQPSVKAP
jgi:hypothetical protein